MRFDCLCTALRERDSQAVPAFAFLFPKASFRQ